MPLRRIIVAPPPSPTSLIINKPTFVINKTVLADEINELINVVAEIGDTAITKSNKMFIFTSEGWKEFLFDLEL